MPVSRTSLLATALLLAFSPAARADLRLIPRPLELKAEAGRFPLKGTVSIAVPSGDEGDLFAAGLLREEIESGSAAKASVRSRSAEGDIVLAREPGLEGAGEEGYRITAGAGGVRVAARSAAGLFYGVQTLRQMVEPAGIPAATISDRPALRWRGIHDDVSRGPVPSLESLKRRIALAAEFKVNLYSLYSEHAIVSRSHPLIAPPGGAYTPAELRELASFARRHHVSLMLQQQVFGHLDRVLGMERYAGLAETPGGGVLSVADPASMALAESLIAEVAPLSSAPFVHVGGDEATEIGTGRSKAVVAERGLEAVYLDKLGRLARIAGRHDKRIMFWGDYVQERPGIASKLPKGSVVAFWEYEKASLENRLAPFRSAGVDVFVCPGVSNWNRIFPNLGTALPNLGGLTAEGQRAGALGQIVCTWDDNGDALFGLTWFPVLYGAAAAWQRGQADVLRFRDDFDWAFLRSPGTEAAEAMERVDRAHRILVKARPSDATIEMAWLNPVRDALDRRLLLMIEPVASSLRGAQEEAIELLERAKLKARRNADLLDYAAFAARRIHAIGQRAQFAARMGKLYGEALQSQSADGGARSLERLKSILGLIAQGREQSALLREEHQRLWLAENRPYWLDNILAQYDRDLQIWTEKWDQVRVGTVRFRNGTPLPSAEQMGF